MEILKAIIITFIIIGVMDYLTGNKLGLGKEFEKGISMLGPLMLSMSGMLIIAPTILHFLTGIIYIFPDFIEPSILTSSILANDMGGAVLSEQLCNNSDLGKFNAMVVSSMMGATVSFTIPVALGMVDKSKYKQLIFGMLCGIVTIPIGCFAGGIIAGIEIIPLITDLIPLAIISVIIAIGLYKAPDKSEKIFFITGKIIRTVTILGLVSGMVELLTGIKLIPYSDTLENTSKIIINAACVMAGAFPLIHCLSVLLKKPLMKLGNRLNINNVSTVGFVSSLATSLTTFELMKDMDNKGIILNSAFAVSASFVFADHLAFTMAFMPEYTASVIVGKLAAGFAAIAAANKFSKLKNDITY